MKVLRNILPAVLLVFATQAGAQKITGGIVGGVSTGSVKISGIPNSFTNVVSGGNITGLEGGFYMKLNAGPFYGRPELLYNHRQGTVDLQQGTNEAAGSASFEMSRLEIPVMFGLDLLGPVAIEIGPVYNKVLSVTENYNNEKISIKRGGVGYRLGGVVSLGRVGIGIHYQGLKINSSDSSESNFESPTEMIFSVSLRLGE